MYQSSSYPSVTQSQVDQFIAENFQGKCIAVDSEGYPVVSLLPFQYFAAPDAHTPSRFDLHLVQEDKTFQALSARGACTFFIDQPLAFTPHTIVSKDYAGYATLHFRAIAFYCQATTSIEPTEVGQVLDRLVHHYEPNQSFHPVTDNAFYHRDLSRLGVAHLTVTRWDAKFKLAQNRSPEERAILSQFLEERNAPLDPMALQIMKQAWD
ncbi:MAG: FMN-binding negative transcriptional regulator [Sulfobacillus sp.]